MGNYIELSAAIVVQAMIDYKEALRDIGRNAEKTREECERFFLSDWGQMLSANSGERIIKLCKEEVRSGKQSKRRRRFDGRSKMD